MSGNDPKVCPACRRPARNRPLPPEGFWQEQVLQRLGMYPYRCEDCGARFYRRVPVGRGLGAGRYQTPPAGAVFAENSPSPSAENETPKILVPPESEADGLSHEDFVDLIHHISRSEQRKGLKVTEKKDDEQ